MAPNILLIVFDTARADAFEPYGAAPGTSPVVADLARRGRALDPVYAASCWTMPSHAAMFTGLLPRRAGMTRAPGGDAFALPPLVEAHRERLLAEVLGRAGYATAGISANLWVSKRTGFATGFDRFVDVDSHLAADAQMSDRRFRARWALSALAAREDNGAGKAAEVIEGWLGERVAQGPGSEPFFWFVNLIEAHSPYLPPKPYTDLGPIERLRAGEEARRHLTLDETWKACAGGFDVPDAALERMRHGYRGSIRLLDDWLGRVLEALDGAGVLDETLVIATSDHGENFGEGGLMQHAFSLDDRLLRVPFVCAGPGTPTAIPAGRPLSLAALPALLANVAGVDAHPWQEVNVDSVPVAEFDPPAPFQDPELVAAALDVWGLDAEKASRISSPLTASMDGRLKLLRRGQDEELFDTAQDPLEQASIAASGVEPGAVARLRAAFPEPADAAGPADAGAAEGIDDAEREALEQRMRVLGYL